MRFLRSILQCPGISLRSSEPPEAKPSALRETAGAEEAKPSLHTPAHAQHAACQSHLSQKPSLRSRAQPPEPTLAAMSLPKQAPLLGLLMDHFRAFNCVPDALCVTETGRTCKCRPARMSRAAQRAVPKPKPSAKQQTERRVGIREARRRLRPPPGTAAAGGARSAGEVQEPEAQGRTRLTTLLSHTFSWS